GWGGAGGPETRPTPPSRGATSGERRNRTAAESHVVEAPPPHPTTPRGVLPPAKGGLARLDEGARGFAMVLGEARARVVPGLEVETVLQRAGLGRVHVALHVAERDARTMGEPGGEGLGLLVEPRVRHHP